MKNPASLFFIVFASFNAYSGVVDDHWDPGDELGPPECGSSGGPQGHVGNPIHAGMGNKFQGITVYKGNSTNPLTFGWSYNSELIGTGVWQYNIQRSLNPVEVNPNEYDFHYENGDGSYASITFDTPVASDASCVGSAPGQVYEQISPGGMHKVSATTLQGASCEVLDSSQYFNPNGQVENYSYSGMQPWNNGASRLTHIDFPNGERHTYSYDPLLQQLTVQHSNGQSMVVSYTQKSAEVGSTVLLPSQLTVGALTWTFEYEEIEVSTNNKSQILERINGPDGTSNEFDYKTEIVSGNLPNPVLKALLTDRYINGQHAAGWVYNENHRAYRSYHGPNPSSLYEGASFFDSTQWGALELSFYSGYNYTASVDEFGRETEYNYSVWTGYQGKKKSKLQGVYGSPSTNCFQTYYSVDYDQFWRVTETLDSNNTVDKKVYTSGAGARGRLKTMTYAVGSGYARVFNYEYEDEDRNLVSKIIENRLTREFDYYANGRLKESRLIDTTTHTNPYPTGGTIQKTTYAYEYYDAEQRQLKAMTVDGPRTDVADISIMNYDTQGRLTTVVDALAHVTTFSDFNEWNLPESISKTNLTTLLEYQNGFNQPLLTSLTIGSQAPNTTTYNPFELPEQVTLPSGTFKKYFYKTMDKESLYLVENNLGEQTRIDRTIDTVLQVENIVQGTYEDGFSTNPTSSETNVYDALGRLYQAYNSLGGKTEYIYNENNKVTEILQSGVDGDGNLAYPYKMFNYNYRDRLSGFFDNYRYTNFEYTNIDQLKKVQDALYRNTNHVVDAFGNNIQIVSPDSGKTKYYFDEANNLTRVIDAENVTKEYQYDELNRLTNMNYPASPSENIQLVYDGNAPQQNGEGRLTEVVGPGGITTYFYDSEGNLSRKTWSFNGQTYDYFYVYQNGLLDSVTYPSGRILSYSRDALGNINQVTWADGINTGSLINQVTYNPFGPVKNYQYGNGIAQSFLYDSDYRIQRITSSGVLDLDYDYDGFENVTEITDILDPSKNQSIRYDEYNEIVNATGPYGFFEYTYDDLGNRAELTKNGVYHAYEYNSSLRLNRVFNYTDWKLVDRFKHRKNGDAYEVGGSAINMNHADQVASIVNSGVTTTYLYNHGSQRVYKSTGDIAYHYDQAGQLIAETDATTGAALREYYYLGTYLVATLVPPSGQASQSNDLQYVHLNHLATPIKVTDSQQQVVWSAVYNPFGETNLLVENTTFNIRFPGQYYDAESAFYYNGHRYYSPKHGRYLQSDPIGLEGGINTYAYVGGNPLNAVDPTGLDILVIGGGRRTGSLNFPGHVGMAFTGHGTFSYGNDTALGSSTASYIETQSAFRNQVVVLIPATPSQDAAGANYLSENYPDPNGVGYLDNCAVRTNEGVMAAGFPSLEIPFPGGLTRKAQSLPDAKTYFVPKDGPIPQALLDVLPSFEPVPTAE